MGCGIRGFISNFAQLNLKGMKAMKRLLILMLILVQGCYSMPKTESPVSVVKQFGKCYGKFCMDEIVKITTAKFRDNKPGSVWVTETWEALNGIKFQRLKSEFQTCNTSRDKAVVVMKTRISTVAGNADQRDVYLLVRDGNQWKIDDLQVTDEVVDVEKLLL